MQLACRQASFSCLANSELIGWVNVSATKSAVGDLNSRILLHVETLTMMQVKHPRFHTSEYKQPGLIQSPASRYVYVPKISLVGLKLIG